LKKAILTSTVAFYCIVDSVVDKNLIRENLQETIKESHVSARLCCLYQFEYSVVAVVLIIVLVVVVFSVFLFLCWLAAILDNSTLRL